jgi:hypothetical protein
MLKSGGLRIWRRRTWDIAAHPSFLRAGEDVPQAQKHGSEPDRNKKRCEVCSPKN